MSVFVEEKGMRRAEKEHSDNKRRGGCGKGGPPGVFQELSGWTGRGILIFHGIASVFQPEVLQ